ncbi:Eco57I restriction-modification methylase domain-containing protein [Haladaptatus cibarius]|uniref:Eco57I restriction-modification methylase domain-containing protein n=1 Tax=Haladaptatus cibarius TaxID=453847 RepID=UPI000678DBC3|nr:DNA methyltransferase [Haladaptatus cibarius]
MAELVDASPEVKRVLESFLDDLEGRLSTHDLEDVLQDSFGNLTSKHLGMKPETHAEEKLIYPLLEAVGLAVEKQPYGEKGGQAAWPDFSLMNLDTLVIGENKKLNEVETGVPELKDYLDRKSIGAEYGIVTDGFTWYVKKIELGGDFTEYPDVEEIDLREAILSIAREKEYIGSRDVSPVDVDDTVTEFAETFGRDSFNHRLSQTAPREIRDKRKRDVEAFYELYIELLFGESDKHESEYETCLMDDIEAPPGTTERDKRLFAISLMNRLLFVKFLEQNDILDDGFLREREQFYSENVEEIPDSLYDFALKPLFYDLLNTDKDGRLTKHRNPDSWFDEVPYLNGGLFRETIPQEGKFTVRDRILPEIITDLVEGSNLELDGKEFDPAILGSVFEKTINHIEQERTQKDIGAYYTPNDVTKIVTEQSVDPKIKDVLAEVFAESVGDDEEDITQARKYFDGVSLADVLWNVEEGTESVLNPGKNQTTIDFGDESTLETALAQLRELKVIDPACGSGHFLTTSMDEIHRAQESLLRGLNDGDAPEAEDRFREKKQLALHSIYGVDVDKVAAEIAKLRIWLKIVEDNGWKEAFGRLPNIDVNITDGNSLVGLPMTGSFDDTHAWTDDMTEVEEKRIRYKETGEGDPREIEAFMDEEVRPELNQQYLDLFTKPVKTSIEDEEEFERVMQSLEDDTLYPAISLLRVKREDGDAFGEDETETLEDIGFSVYTKSAKIDLSEWESTQKRIATNEGEEYDVSDSIETFRDLIQGEYVFSEVQRRPLNCDLDDILGKPFHWVAEFPEVADGNGNSAAIDFDIVLGNPPYGDLLSDEEKMFISTYETSDINDISANFVERQLQLLEDGGYFGNVTTLRLVYQSSMEEFHDLLRENMPESKIACFAKRPTKVFEGAEVRIAIITGKKADIEEGDILTSEYLRFSKNDRDERFSILEYQDVDGLILRDKIGGSSGKYEVLPKIGNEMIRNILLKLRENSRGQSSTVFRERILDDETEYVVWRREGLDYWTNPMLGELYSAREVKPMYFETELEQRGGFLLISSSLFYLYWVVYGNMHHLNWGQIEAFPFPSHEELEKHEKEIFELSEELWTGMKQGFNKELNQFNYQPLKPTINKAEKIFGEIYDLSKDEVRYLQKYHSQYGRSGSDNEQISEY